MPPKTKGRRNPQGLSHRGSESLFLARGRAHEAGSPTGEVMLSGVASVTAVE
jgi:hypothetical protein